MQILSLQRILMGLAMIVFVGALAAGATGAFFSDTESSTGNTFAAGALDLTIDNTSYGFDYNNPAAENPTGIWGPNASNSWTLRDLDTCGPNNNQPCLFFNFADLKPGDYGEDTISLHVQNNAWACMALNLTGTPDNGINEPEGDAGDVTDGPLAGELQNYLSFMFWNDDGDNVLETGETVIQALSGLPGSIFTGAWLPIAEGGETPDTPLQAGATTYIGKGWCFGTMTASPVTQDNASSTPPAPGRTGFTCSGADPIDGPGHNVAQTDGITVDVEFYGVQSRNNAGFLCSSLPPIDDEEPVRPLVGAANFVAGSPTCDITANDDGAVSAGFTAGINAIGDAVTAATPGQTICVAPGTYNEFTVNKAVTIRGTSDPEGGTPAVVVPSSTSVTDLALVNSDNVTITGLKFDGNGTITAGQAAGVRVSPLAASLSGVNITYNVVTNISAATGFAAKGIQWFTDTDSGFSLSNSSFANNTISNIASVNKGGYGIQTVGPMSSVAIQNNTISNTTGAWGAGVAVDTKNSTLTSVTGSTITRNQILTGVSDGISRFSVQIENRVNATGVGVHENNIETSLLGGGNVAFGTEGNLNAQSNWWGTAAPILATDVFNSGANTTDFTLPEAAAFALN